MARSFDFLPQDVVNTAGKWSGTSTPASNTDCVVTLTGTTSDAALYLKTIIFSYSGTPTGGLLTVTVGGSTVFRQAVTASGVGPVEVEGIVSPRIASTGLPAEIVVTLSAGGAGVTGYLNVSSW